MTGSLAVVGLGPGRAELITPAASAALAAATDLIGYGPYLDERRYEIILDNCRRFQAGRPLRNLVDKAHWF